MPFLVGELRILRRTCDRRRIPFLGSARIAVVSIVLLVSLLVAATAVWWGVQPQPHSTAPVVYAYTTAHTVVVVRDGRTVAQRTGDFGIGAAQPQWTADGQWLFFLLHPASTLPGDTSAAVPQPRLVTIHPSTGTVRDLACPACASVGAVRADVVLAAQHDGTSEDRRLRLLHFDLASGQAPIQFTTTLPAELSSFRFLTATAGTAVAAGTDPSLVSAYGGPERLFVMDGTGAARPVPFLGGDMAFSSATGVRESVDRSGIVALVGGTHAGACEWGNSVELLDTRSGTVTMTDLSAAVPPQANTARDSGLAVSDLWWNGDGTLHATISAWRCDHRLPDPHVAVIRPSLWHLDGSRWRSDGPAPAGMTRPLGSGRQLQLAPPPSDGSGSTLVLQTPEHTSTVATHVQGISVP
ncbi:hypothetical protein ABZ721_18850 [Streptomyces sp. NPDC006733]|uniref:hypothetical protein n=1 Tax=Streptomyces sp. NPDC006733 TaxID=3155460 RepID=UPI0033F3F364